MKKGCDLIKRLIVLLIVFSLVLTSCTGGESTSSTETEASTSTQAAVKKQVFIADGLGISFQYDSDWYVDKNGQYKAELSVLYDTQVKVTISLLDQLIDLDTGMENNIGDLLKAKYTKNAEGFYQSEVVSVDGFQRIKTDKAEWIRMMAKIKNEYFENYTGYIFSPPAQVAFYFVNIQGNGYFVKLESQVENVEFCNEIDDLVDSMFFIHVPSALSSAFSFEDLVYGDVSYIKDS